MEQERLEKLAQQIAQMNRVDMERAFQLLMQQWEILHPEYELLLASVPKNDPQEQKRLVEFAVRMIDAQANT